MKADASIVEFNSNASFSPLRDNRMTCVKTPMLTMLSLIVVRILPHGDLV